MATSRDVLRFGRAYDRIAERADELRRARGVPVPTVVVENSGGHCVMALGQPMYSGEVAARLGMFIGPSGLLSSAAGATDIRGAPGSPGAPGSGADGKSVELQKTATAIQWRQTAGTWADLVLLSALKGADGAAGTVFQSARVTTDSAGLFTWTFPTPFAAGVVPHVWAIAEGPNPAAGTLVNVQVEGAPTNTQAKFRVTKSAAAVASLLGLTILSVPATVGATPIHVFAKAP